MAYRTRINALGSLSPGNDSFQVIQELDAIYNDLTDLRTKYTALVALLVAATALGAGYSAGTALNTTRNFSPT